MLRKFLILSLLPFAAGAQEAPSTPAPQQEPPAIVMDEPPLGYYDLALLQGLNKVTARISQLEVPVGTSTRFGNLEIIVRKCWSAPPTERPENAALLEVVDRKPDEVPEQVYNGWMFSSSPSLAGLEHPVYDVTVLECQRRQLGDDT